MGTTQEILKAAGELGRLIAGHESAVKMQSVIDGFKEDIDAQRLLNDYQRQMAKIGEKEAHQQPIEVEDKHRLESLQGQVMRHEKLRELQITQMDYLDLMRRVDEAIAGESSPGGVGAAMNTELSDDLAGGGLD